MEKPFENKVALVLGGTSGIGRTTALAFAEQGASVVVGGRNVDGGAEIERLIKAVGAQGFFQRTDVTSLEQVAALVDKTMQAFGGLHCAFNNAGWEGTGEATADLSESAWQKMIDIKLNGVWRGMKCEIPVIVASGGGAIVNMAGSWGLVGFPNYASYCAAAHGVMGLTKAAAMEYAGNGLRVNAICPGAVDAPMLDRVAGGDAMIKTSFGEQLPIGRVGTQREVAEAVLWLASDAASYVNGTGLVLDGGGSP